MGERATGNSRWTHEPINLVRSRLFPLDALGKNPPASDYKGNSDDSRKNRHEWKDREPLSRCGGGILPSSCFCIDYGEKIRDEMPTTTTTIVGSLFGIFGLALRSQLEQKNYGEEKTWLWGVATFLCKPEMYKSMKLGLKIFKSFYRINYYSTKLFTRVKFSIYICSQVYSSYVFFKTRG